TFGATIDEETHAMVLRNAALLAKSAPERISYELFLIMNAPNAYPIVHAMADAGLLETIFPELTATRKVTPNAYHHLGLWDHSLVALSEAEQKLAEMPEWVFQSYKMELSAGLTRLGATKIATLLHDIGKPGTWVITPEGRH